MGRRPNSLILQYFERGPKLADNSNRYPHTCKACGENFPKGRIDSLTNHLTKKCPAISEADRINACLTLHGIHHAANRGQKAQPGTVQPNGPPVDLPMIQRDWTALETLAEVSRQIEASEKQPVEGLLPGVASAPPPLYNYDMSNVMAPAANVDLQQHVRDMSPVPETDEATVVENLISLVKSATESATESATQSATESAIKSESANLSMAAAAAARLNPSVTEAPSSLAQEEAPTETITEESIQQLQQQQEQQGQQEQQEQPVSEEQASVPVTTASQPWGEITYMSEMAQQPRFNLADVITHAAADLAKNQFHMNTVADLNGAKSRHSRARFDATRRKEVQEVRKIGACIRCRILRKTCSKGHPCDTCRKVLSPRVWRSGCVRTKFSEQLDLYSAGVQIVLAQNRVNGLKARWPLSSHGNKIVASHFPEKGIILSLDILERDLAFDAPAEGQSPPQALANVTRSVVMIDNDSQDVPGRLEVYMREVLPEFARLEPSNFMRVTLETALRVVEETKDDLLKKSLELWGLVELLDRERQWSISVRSAPASGEYPEWIKDDAQEEQQEIFTTICLQLAAAAERKAGTISKSLLTGMQRVLQDSKTKVDFSMYFATLILLNSVEKSTWAFKAWEQDNLRPLWPLNKDPSTFSEQGHVIADLLRMLLAIRKALPRTTRDEKEGILITEEEDPLIRDYFEKLNLNYADVQAKQESPSFSPTDPRSFELLFCSTLLLPPRA